MLSPSGKVEWLCAKCKAREITRGRFGGLNVWMCLICGWWQPWRTRLKRSTQCDAATELK